MSGPSRLVLATLGLLTTAAVVTAQTPEQYLHMTIGDPARRDEDVQLVLDGITATASGEVITPAELPGRLEGTQLLLIGETHTSVESHRVQLRVIEALQAAGRKVLIGLEMFPYTEQKSLDQWRDGLLTEQGFVTLARWYEHWGYHWRYYRDIFLFARDRGIPMYAVNTPREVVTAVRKKGFENLTPEEAARIPPQGVDVDSADHMAFFKASFEEGDRLHGGFNEEAWKMMLAAQATWDASMGWNAVQALEQQHDPNAIMVVLVGSGHVAYDVGIVRQVRRWFDRPVATLIPIPVASFETGERVDAVRASYATYVWGVLPERNSTYPVLGIQTRGAEGGQRAVLQVEEGSAAEKAGFEVNDVLLSMDGHSLSDRETLNILLAHKSWGDAARFVVKRGEEEKTLIAYFRREPPVVSTPATAPAGTDKEKEKGAPKKPSGER